MKRIAIFIDGTWNRPDAEHPTNVVRLSRCVMHSDAEGYPQCVIYSPGVGAGQGNNRLARRMDRMLGGALGWGLTDIIEQSYRNLVFAYEPGDEIYIFGFSRGAFAARSLAGLIRCCGIPPRRHLARIPEAMARYVARGKTFHPEDPSSYEFRADFAPYTATSSKELQWRLGRGDEAIRLTIAYLGVWDTVKALGLPGFVPMAARFNAQYEFHDDQLSSSVLSARHAVAMDERRKTFPSLRWGNVETLNAEEGGHAKGEVPAYAQQWFPGDHGSVGGGGARVGLSSVPLMWIAQGAERAGLRLSWPEFDRVTPRFDPVGEHLTNKFGPVGLTGAFLNAIKTDREGLKEVRDVSVALLDRVQRDSGYRPAGLRFVRDELLDRPASEVAALRDMMVARDGGPTHEPDEVTRPRPWEPPRNAPLPSDQRA
ncbi:DUF2235 domain-containing protein [Flavimaricola marinus]|uniref:T6SS Phospholipase effector Tle1-like catalytic domain-containing protein n=1 Tax=Flavimaricola marinus TaxID=1819565 RepID=A0A238LI62_9RHOB|nr:DUF2235 domain-containing protein [Flavimaricola marinus]SMY09085.1 hypothetical protein LOM8899_03247 [Flavimaricola marinus]